MWCLKQRTELLNQAKPRYFKQKPYWMSTPLQNLFVLQPDSIWSASTSGFETHDYLFEWCTIQDDSWLDDTATTHSHYSPNKTCLVTHRKATVKPCFGATSNIGVFLFLPQPKAYYSTFSSEIIHTIWKLRKRRSAHSRCRLVPQFIFWRAILYLYLCRMFGIKPQGFISFIWIWPWLQHLLQCFIVTSQLEKEEKSDLCPAAMFSALSSPLN